MDDIYNELVAYEPERKQRVMARMTRPGDEFKPVAVLVEALKANGWVLRDVVDFFYKGRFKHIPEGQRINNQQLINKLCAWRKQKLYTREDVEIELIAVKQNLGKGVTVNDLKSSGIVSQNTIDIMAQDYNAIDFLKYYKELNGDFDDVKKVSLMSFYKNNKDNYLSLEGLMMALRELEKNDNAGD